MEYRFDIDVDLALGDVEIEADSRDEAEDLLLEKIKDALSDFCTIENIDITSYGCEVITQGLTAEVTNIKIEDEDLQALVPEELEVNFTFTKYPERNPQGYTRLDLAVEDAVEEELQKIKGLEEAEIKSLEYDIIDTEDGEEFSY